MQKCRVCGGADFYKDVGYFFCQTCQTQSEDVREEVFELRVDNTTRLRKTKIRQLRSHGSGEELGWTSWELYNFVLIGLTNELIELGVPSDIKMTILQLWATYLGKLEVAFISTKKKGLPKLARRYNKKDAEIIYGKIQSQKKIRKRKRIGSSANTSAVSDYQSEGSSMRELSKNKKLLATADYDRYLQSQASSEGDGLSLFSQSVYSGQSGSLNSSNNEGKVKFSSHAKEEARKIKKLSKNLPRHKRAKYRAKHISTKYKMGPYVITPMRLWAILYLALRIHNQPIQLGDMLRYAREGHLSYYKLDHLLPPEVSLTRGERNFLMQNVAITHKGMRRITASLAKFLGVWEIVCPDFLPLVNRYCQELGLPRGIQQYTERLIALSTPKMVFNVKKSYIPNYEGRAIAFIIVVLKTLLALDDITEYQISRIAEKISSALDAGKVQMDASLMDGLSFKCGSVAAVSDIEHPITLAKYVLHNFPNTIFVGDGAKNLAKYAGLNWISEGNMVAPLASMALSTANEEESETHVDNLSLLGRDMLTNSFGTVGCVAYDGHSIAAGTTTGGLNKKLVGRVGDTPLLGCGTYATRNIGCSLTGHGESIIKLGLARTIVEDIENGFTGEEALYKHLSSMLNKYEKPGGAIVLQSNGHWATYFTSDKMPYAVIENDVITFGARIHEERREMCGPPAGKSCGCECPVVIISIILVAIERGVLNEKLFSFQEWQKYIECRKTILIHSHFPTKIRYSPNTHGIDDLYMKFLEFITSKTDNKEPDPKNTKYRFPEEIVDAMTKYITSLRSNDVPPETGDIFPPSLTPLHSYLQHLLDNPLSDIPSVARKDFFLTKVGYMTKPHILIELATKCGIKLDIIDSSLHFLEKVVPPFEQHRMPSIDELKQLIDVQDDSNPECKEQSEDLNDYIHRKIPCLVKLDVPKELYYNSIRTSVGNLNNDLGNDFTFTETLSNGKLAIPGDSDNEDEEKDANPMDSINGESILLGNKFCSQYNLRLSIPENESISKGQKILLARNAKGQFIQREEEEEFENSFLETKNPLFQTSTQQSIAEDMFIDTTKVTDENLFMSNGIDINNFDIEDIDINSGFLDLDDPINLSEISLFRDNNTISTPQTSKTINTNNNRHQFFRPFKDYWMYHCIFSRVKAKNFATFERSLPRSFRWLLKQCALTVEMTVEDLYEEVCLIEKYHAYIFKSIHSSDKYNDTDSVSKSEMNLILSKW